MKQSLGCHPAIAQGGELGLMPNLADRAQGILGSPLLYSSCLADLWMAEGRTDVNLLRDFYLNRLAAFSEPGLRWFIDKCNDDERLLGLITVVFPNSPVIRMVRHPLDVMVSVMSQAMDYGDHWGGSLETAARHYALVADLSDELLGRFTTRCLTVRYEDVVGSQAETT